MSFYSDPKHPEWKQGLGQILAYAYMHPKKNKLLVLFKDSIKADKLAEAIKVCNFYGVEVEVLMGKPCAKKWLKRTKLCNTPFIQ